MPGSVRRTRIGTSDRPGYTRAGLLVPQPCDARLSRHFPTVELRVADVCLRVDDAVLLASLARALVETAAREWRLSQPPPEIRLETLNLAFWQVTRAFPPPRRCEPAAGGPGGHPRSPADARPR